MSFRPIYHLNLDPPGVWGCPPLSCRRLRLVGPPGLEGLPEANYNVKSAVYHISDGRVVMTARSSQQIYKVDPSPRRRGTFDNTGMPVTVLAQPWASGQRPSLVFVAASRSRGLDQRVT